MTGTRKIIIVALLALLLTLVCGAALAEAYVLDSIFASVDIPASFPVVLRSENLPQYEEWLSGKGKSLETVTNDFLSRGVLLQAWSEEGDLCFELTATQTDHTKMIFDVNEQSTSVRGTYRLSHFPRNEYSAQGYDFLSSSWKNSDQGRFLILRYTRREMGETLYRGFMRRTIRNGYEITLDMQVYGRGVTDKDNAALDNIWKTFQFIEVQPMPPAASAQINFTSSPPEETNDPNFVMAGTAAEGVQLTAVVMGMRHPEPLLYVAVVDKTGKFKMNVSLPGEGVYLVTVTGENQGEEVVELSFPVKYQRTLLTVNVTSEVPAAISTSALSITGTSQPGATIQAFLNGEPYVQKRVTAAGKFKVDFELKEEGEYQIALAFSKKDLADRRLEYTVTRKWSDEDTLKQLRADAIKPAYRQLINKMKGYEGRIMGYRAYLVSVSQSGEDWIAQMALTKKDGEYSDIILVICHEEPKYALDQRVMMYGTCAGMSLGATGDGADAPVAESYPCFELLLFQELA